MLMNANLTGEREFDKYIYLLRRKFYYQPSQKSEILNYTFFILNFYAEK